MITLDSLPYHIRGGYEQFRRSLPRTLGRVRRMGTDTEVARSIKIIESQVKTLLQLESKQKNLERWTK